MIKLRYFIIFFIVIHQTSLAQKISVVNYSSNPTDSMAYKYPQYDNNGQLCSLVIIKPYNIKDIRVKDSYIVDTKWHRDLLYVWMADHAKNLSVYHSNYETLNIHIPDFIGNNHGVKSGTTYYFDLKGSNLERKERSKESNYVYIESNVPLSSFVLDDKVWTVSKKTNANKLVSCGEYTYHACAEGYKEISGHISVTKSFEPVVIKLLFTK